MDAFVTGSGGTGSSHASAHTDAGGRPLGAGWSTASSADYTQHREQDSGLCLEVNVRNVAYMPDSGRLEWFFYSRPIKGGNRTIFDQGFQDIAIGASSSERYTIKSKVLHHSVIKKLHTDTGVNALGQPNVPSASVEKKGDRACDWVVRLIVEGSPIIVRASSPTLQAIGSGLADVPDEGKSKKNK